MLTERLTTILDETTRIFQKDERIPEIDKERYDIVNMGIVNVTVDRGRASQYKDHIEKILRDYPEPERLAGGPSYIELAPNLNLEQGNVIRFMALGKTLELWQVHTGETLKGSPLAFLRGGLYPAISGYKPK